MNVYRLSNRSTHDDFRRAVRATGPVGLTIGNFDGMHLGHQYLFEELSSRLSCFRTAGMPDPLAVLLTFHPHPRSVLGKEDCHNQHYRLQPGRLTPFRMKVELASVYGFSCFAVARFDRALASVSAEDFITRYVASVFRPRVVVVGYDWSFGKERLGDTACLSRLAAELNFEAVIVSAKTDERGVRISSSSVKEALGRGDIAAARTHLGRNFAISGLTRRGHGRGRVLGFATANLVFSDQILPQDGVYAVFARIEGKEFSAVANVGLGPTFGGTERSVEVHLLDADDKDLYHKRMDVEFVERLRDEINYSAVADLLSAIGDDITKARKLLADFAKNRRQRFAL